MTFLQIIFLFTAAVTFFAAIKVVSSRRMMHAALWLVLALFGVAVLFATLETRFFAVVQLLVYIGSIAILIIFAIMLTRGVMEDLGPQVNRGWPWMAFLALALFVIMAYVLTGWDQFWRMERTVPAGGEDLLKLGNALVDPAGFAIPFEVASLLLLAALIGSIIIASERKGRHP